MSAHLSERGTTALDAATFDRRTIYALHEAIMAAYDAVPMPCAASATDAEWNLAIGRRDGLLQAANLLTAIAKEGQAAEAALFLSAPATERYQTMTERLAEYRELKAL